MSIICGLPIPLTAIQLLWLNVVTDGLQDIALSFESAEDGILKEKPISPKDSIFNKQLFNEVAYFLANDDYSKGLKLLDHLIPQCQNG